VLGRHYAIGSTPHLDPLPAPSGERRAADFRERYTARFQERNLRATLLKRIVMGNVVIDHEEVVRTFPEGPGKIALIMIYEVQNGRIARAWSIAGAKTLDSGEPSRC